MKILTILLIGLLPLEFVCSQEADIAILEELQVTVSERIFANNKVSSAMLKQQSDHTSVLSVIDNLPGVLVNEGDIFGSDDWSTSISIRGFQNSLDLQQIGITIDGIPNGNSNYGGGAKANRFIDTLNLAGVNVSQGTADIASRSHEALGGTLNFMTQDPEYEQRARFSTTVGENETQKYYLRFDTGEFIDKTRAWLSVSHSENTNWIDQSAKNFRKHAAAKIVSEVAGLGLTGYVSWDDTHEYSYQRITLDEFKDNPNSDRLTDDWTGTPWLDQTYRRGWSTLRENLFTYLNAKYQIGEVRMSATGYYHDNEGRGDWLPPYLTDVTNDAGNANSELSANPQTVKFENSLGLIQFVDANGLSLSPTAGCVSSLTFPYKGADAKYDPACYPAGAIPVNSYRHTHYSKQRFGFMGDTEWVTDIGNFENTLRAGIWYEDYLRKESRDWHKMTDSKKDFDYNDQPYWEQYNREFPVETFVYYLQESIDFGMIVTTFGIRQFFVDLERLDTHTANTLSVNSDSDILLSGGLVLHTLVDGLDLFAGYAENFAAIKDSVLEQSGGDVSNIEAETSINIDLGLRYFGDRLDGAITYYNINFENSLIAIPSGSPAGINFLTPDTTFLNAGGIESQGIEMFVNYRATDDLNLYLSYTHNDSTYLGSGNDLIDQSISITPGNTVFGSVEEMFVVSANWTVSNYSQIGISTKYVGERWLDPKNTQRIGDYIVTDIYLGINGGELSEHLKPVDLRLTVNNITDERYIGSVASGWGGWIGGARTTALSMTISF